MKLSDWASIAEIVSGVAVIVTLIILIIGVNENTRAAYAANNLAIYSELHDIVLTTAGSDSLAALRNRFAEGGWEALNEEEAFRVRIIERSIFRIYETAFYAHVYGTLGSDEWARHVTAICARRKLHTHDQWRDQVVGSLSAAFNEFIESECLDGSKLNDD